MNGASPYFAALLGLLLLAGSPRLSEAVPADSASLTVENSTAQRDGIWLALTGRLAEAESVFTSRLAIRHERMASRNNLGNIHFLRGDVDLARAYYDEVLQGSPDEAGTRLNRALLYYLLGDTAEALNDAARGIRTAGSIEQAGDLLGIAAAASTTHRAAPGAALTPVRVRELLQRALKSVPMDSTTVTAPLRPSTTATPASGSSDRRLASLTTSGARASRATPLREDEAQLLYWIYAGSR